MANLIQAVVRAGWWVAAIPLLVQFAASAAFSHRVHLSQKIDCLVCHAKATTSAKAGDNLLPAVDVCATCHTGKLALPTTPAIKAPRQLTVSKFNHQLHLKLGNIAPVVRKAVEAKTYLSDPGNMVTQLADARNTCMACHRGLTTSDAVTAAVFPRMADCLVCHNEVDPPFSCEKCHDATQQLKPVSHGAGWMDRHSSGKANLDKPSCAVCHGRQFKCMGCHGA